MEQILKKSRWRRIFRYSLKCLLVCVLASVALVLMFRFLSPPVSALMIERRIDSWSGTTRYSPTYKWVPFDRIAPVMAVAVIAAEDQNFYQHHGFDWGAIQRAIDYNENSDRTRGASTITQQTVKNLFLWSGRDWIRKGAEAYFTVLLESFWNKNRILETYLNIVEFGDGIYGAEAAAQTYFGKSASRLSAEEAALLAAVLPNPHRLKVQRPSAYVRERQQWILEQMNQLGGSGLVKNRI
jgi:monofunctional glycosyltransferase